MLSLDIDNTRVRVIGGGGDGNLMYHITEKLTRSSKAKSLYFFSMHPRVDANSINLASEAGGPLIDEHEMFVSLSRIMGFPSTSSPLPGSARTVWHT